MTKYKFKEVLAKEQKGPVSAITSVLGFLVTAVGQKVSLITLRNKFYSCLQYTSQFTSDLSLATQG